MVFKFFFIVVMVFIQIQSVTEEKKRLKADLDEAYKRHKEELEIQQLQHFQVNIGGEGENWLKKGKRDNEWLSKKRYFF